MTSIKEYLKQDQFESVGQEAMLSLFVATAFLKKTFQQICMAYGLTISQFNILRILRGTLPNGYARYEITDRMVEPAPDMTRLINRLIKAGYVKRVKSKIDKRQSLAYITELGLAHLKEIDPAVVAFNHNLADKIGIRASKELINICKQIIVKK